MLGRTDSRGRLLLLFFVLALISGGMVVRLAYWQLNQHEQLVSLVSAETSTIRTSVPAQRGTIYDRTGTIVLAQTVPRYRIVGDLHAMTETQRKRDADALVDYLDLSGDAEAALRKAMSSTGYYVVVATNVDASVASDIAQGQGTGALPTMTLESTPVRVYPQAGGAPHTSLAAQMLGFVNAAGHGQYGLEQAYDSILAGRPGIMEVDPGTPGPAGRTLVDAGTPGQDIRTTIDAGLQLKLEQEVFSAWIADKAKTVSAVVMDPKTGALLAEASYPSYDANLYSLVAAQDPGLFVDPVISSVYEPGSVFKMLTASAALQTGTTSLTTKINDYGVMELPDGQEVADADRKAKGLMTFADIVAWSRNVGATQVAFRLGKTVDTASAALYATWKSYGIGQKTGIDLAGEVSGIARDPATAPWRQIDLANASFGQGVAVPPIEIMRAYAIMENGGSAITPYVAQGSPGAASPSPVGPPVIATALASSLTSLMTHVVTVVPSYAQATWIPGYYVGGKTGTAQIWDPTLDGGKGAWLMDIYNYSFYGWVGNNSPDLAVGVVIYQGVPTTVAQGVLDMPIQSSELFRRVATDAVVSLRVPANPNGPPPPAGRKAGSLG